MSTTPVVLDAGATSLESAQANVLASSQAQCVHLNENLKAIYLTAFDNWKISVEAGRIEPTDTASPLFVAPPRPPKAYVVKDDGNGWFFPEPGDETVCDMPPIPESMIGTPHKTPAQLAQEEYLKSHRPMSAGETPANPPVGTHIVDPATGLQWVKVGFPTPFGLACEWQQAG